MPLVDIDRAGPTAVLTLNRPERRNALDLAMRAALAEAIASVKEDTSVRAVVLTGAGGHFCAGGDAKQLAQQQDDEDGVFRTRERLRDAQHWLDELLDLEKPVIAAVDGAAFGAGLSLALCADFVLLSRRARLCAVFSRIGLVPDFGAMYLLPRLVGLGRAKELVFSARVVEAEEAVRIGLAYALAEGDVLAEALALAAQFHRAPTEAIGIAKNVMNHAFESDRRAVYRQEAMAQALCRESRFHREALGQFLDK